MRTGIVGQTYPIIVDTPDTITGLTDVSFAVSDTLGNPVAGSPFAAVEISNKGVYTATWTPASSGDYVVEVSSPSQGISEVSSAVRIDPVSNQQLSNEIAALENLNASQVWSAASRTLTDKEGFSLSADERTNIANAVQQVIIDEGDGGQVIDAIVQAIGNANIDEIAFVAAVTANLERDGGVLSQILAASSSSNVTFRVIN